MSELKESEFQFKTPELIDLQFSTNDIDMPGSVRIPQHLTANFTDIDEKRESSVVMTLTIGDKTNEMPFFLKISMKSDFRWGEGIDDKKAIELLKYNGVSMLISYARPIISNITSSSKYPTYNLPFLDIREDKYEKKN